MFYPGFQKVVEFSKEYNIIPVSMEVYADMETPISIFKRFEEKGPCFLLESVEGGEKWARYSFIGFNPFLTVKSFNGKTVLSQNDGTIVEKTGNPIHILHDILREYKGATPEGIPRFNGGAAGFFGYDTARYFESLPNCPPDDLKLPECHFLFCDEIIAFDHLKQKIHIIVNLHIGGNLERAYSSVVQRIKDIYKEITLTRWKTGPSLVNTSHREHKPLSLESNITKEQFCNNVMKAKEYIRNGDIFQVVLSQRLSVKIQSDPFNVYRVLRTVNPSGYMYYFKFDDYSIAGSSPERLVRVEDGIVETCPIAGTRKRGASRQEDDELEQDLLNDEKELAEHTMLVDLGRNDIGRVSKFGSVKVRDLMHVEKYSHVMHIVTNVQGELRNDRNALDALVSVLPAGTLSGAPKVRAMEIIDELESMKRGTYGGAIGYLSFNGNLDSCITIRTIIFKDGSAYIQAGAGIVADSDPDREYDESMNKARAMLTALEKVGDLR